MSVTYDVCWSCTDTACFSASSNTASPVVLVKSATKTRSRSGNAGVRVVFHSQNPRIATTSAAAIPTITQRLGTSAGLRSHAIVKNVPPDHQLRDYIDVYEHRSSKLIPLRAFWWRVIRHVAVDRKSVV